MTGDYYLSQDVCQETFLKLCNCMERLEEKQIKFWLIEVALNLSRDYSRKGGKYKEILGDYSDWPELAGSGDNVAAYLDRLSRKELVCRMMEGLRRKNRNWYEVYVLTECLELPRKRVALRKGIALSTVDSYLHKSRAWMKSHYGKEYEEL